MWDAVGACASDGGHLLTNGGAIAPASVYPPDKLGPKDTAAARPVCVSNVSSRGGATTERGETAARECARSRAPSGGASRGVRTAHASARFGGTAHTGHRRSHTRCSHHQGSEAPMMIAGSLLEPRGSLVKPCEQFVDGSTLRRGVHVAATVGRTTLQ